MNRTQLEHAIRAACDVAEDEEIYIIGSQAILGEHPDAPPSLLVSMEVDAIPKNNPEAWEDIDGALGELSMFHETHGFYVQGLDLAAAKLPPGWKTRCITVQAGKEARGFCLEGHDLALSKLAAFREKDRDFVRTLLVEKLAEGKMLLERLKNLPVEDSVRSAIDGWLRRTIAEMDAK